MSHRGTGAPRLGSRGSTILRNSLELMGLPLSLIGATEQLMAVRTPRMSGFKPAQLEHPVYSTQTMKAAD